MKVPFLDLKVQYKSIKPEIDKAIQEIIDNTAFILGNSVQKFEQEFAKAHNVKHCFGTGSGTDANHLALWILGVGQGDEVIIPANTFIATAWGATLCGAKPVFVDCESDSYNIDPEKIERAITPKTKAIVAVHLYGQPADLNRIREIANRHKIHLVEDAAQAHFAEYYGNRIGGLSEAASFSFYPGKNLGAYGEGGAVTTNRDDLAAKVNMMRNHGQSKRYYHDELGHNYRMEGIQGAVLGVKLQHLDKWTEGRRRAAAKYKELLSDCERIFLPKEMPYAKHVYHLFVVRVNSNGKNKPQEVRDQLQKFLNENGIDTGLHYPVPLHMQKCFSNLGYKYGDFPVTENLAESGISLPMFPELNDDQISFVSEKVKEFFKKN
jgi:dTDP-4-amino-4,6-dideoxygalactose transaminase